MRSIGEESLSSSISSTKLQRLCWVGAILGLWFGARRGKLGSEWVQRTAPRVSGVAGWTVTILILSGLYTAYYSLGADSHRLIDSAYGRTLVDKVCAAMLVLLIGAYNRYWVMPAVSQASAQESLLRNVGVESLLLIGVAGARRATRQYPAGTLTCAGAW